MCENLATELSLQRTSAALGAQPGNCVMMPSPRPKRADDLMLSCNGSGIIIGLHERVELSSGCKQTLA